MNNNQNPAPTPLQTHGDEKPVAYTVDGQPLYAKSQPEIAPAVSEPVAQAQPTPNIISHEQKPSQPNLGQPNNLSDEKIAARHMHSVRNYPLIQFMPNEYVVIGIKRTYFGVVKNWFFTIIIPIIMVGFLFFMDYSEILTPEIFIYSLIIGGGIFFISLLSSLISNYVFTQNRLVITNERVFRRTQLTPFSYSDESVELDKIEKCSFSQEGPIELMMNYGRIKLSTVGNEKNHELDYVSNPQKQLQVINLILKNTGN